MVQPGTKIEIQRNAEILFQKRKWSSLRKSFRKSKKKASKNFYNVFVNELKVAKPSQYYKMAKRIGAIEQKSKN